MSGNEIVPNDYVPVDPDEDEDDDEVEAPYEWKGPARAKRTSASDVWVILSTAKSAGDIFDYKKVKSKKGTRWVIQTVPTNYDHYHNPDAQGTIVLSNREVMAFAEGLYAAIRLTHDEEGRGKRVEGERWYPTNRAGDYIR